MWQLSVAERTPPLDLLPRHQNMYDAFLVQLTLGVVTVHQNANRGALSPMKYRVSTFL